MAKLTCNNSEAGLPGRLIRVLVHQMLDDRRHLGQAALLASDREHLDSVDAFDRLTMCSPAEFQGRLGVSSPRRQNRHSRIACIARPWRAIHCTCIR